MFEFILKPIKKRYGADREYYIMLDEIFGIYPNNIELYKLALIHRSASILLDDGMTINNERLEFLGDAILEGVVSDYIFIEYPEQKEGFMTKLRSKIVSRTTLNKLCVELGLDRYIISQSGGSYIQKHIYGDALEAMIGAIYLDKGYDYANRLLINRILKKHLDMDSITTNETDYKSNLIEWCQKSKRVILFNTTHSSDSTAQHPIFRSAVLIDGAEVGYGNGTSKKEAEQNAALSVSQVLSDDEVGDHLLEVWDSNTQNSEKQD